MKSGSINSQINRPISRHLDRTSLVNKGFIVWFSRKFLLRDTAGSSERARYLHLAHLGSQSQRAIWFILPTHGATHIICLSVSRAWRQFNSFSVVSTGVVYHLPSRIDVMLCDLHSGKFFQYPQLSVAVTVGQLEYFCSLSIFRPFHFTPRLPHNKNLDKWQKKRRGGESKTQASHGKEQLGRWRPSWKRNRPALGRNRRWRVKSGGLPRRQASLLPQSSVAFANLGGKQHIGGHILLPGPRRTL